MPEPSASKPRVAVIGLGSMGFGMATSLRRAGFDVTGGDVSADAVARFVADGGKGAPTPAEAAKQPALSSAWWSTRATETILFGKDGVRRDAGEDAVFVSSRPWTPTRRGGWQSSWRPPGGTTGRADLRRRAARRAGRALRFSPQAAQPLLQKHGLPLDAMGKHCTKLGTPQGRAPPSR